MFLGVLSNHVVTDLMIYALNAVSGVEYKLSLSDAEITALFRDKTKWLKARKMAGWRVAAKPLLVQV